MILSGRVGSLRVARIIIGRGAVSIRPETFHRDPRLDQAASS
jgi:hypothetical protein